MFPLYDTIPSRKKPYVVYFLIIINVVIFLYQQSLSRVSLLAFLYNYGLIPARFTNPRWEQLWQIRTGIELVTSKFFTFLSHMFLHGGWSHLIGNMWFLAVFGDNVEDALGHVRFALFYLAGGIFAALTHFAFNLTSTVPIVGASGAISAVMGAYYVLFPYSRIISFVPLFFLPFLVAIPAAFYLFVWFLMQVINGLFDNILRSGVAYWAHAGGFVFGILIGLWKRRSYYRW
ncbi:rhomboid family intramembrane serine protease [Pseudothermotoga thermarum]|uniref:Rhomboid family protein n=1 Tax=Pseudothermotoga thermarum DSM 5069 TaxID=688269 RepID=F7YX65_9THEM|nr:rhomboid family intramembrane serine protease [Pseudothermotoga thermarum]AEH51023.1 Rhomboid family protein [Pseudothermotoga thermarum DSM 5069]